MSARGIIGGLTGMAASAVKHPVSTTEQALVAAKQMATTGTIVADKLIKKGLGKDGKDSARTSPSRPAPAQVRETAAKATATAAESVEKAAGKVERTAEKVADKADDVEAKAEHAAKPAPPKPTAKKAPKPSPAKRAPAKDDSAGEAEEAKPTPKAPAPKAPAKKPAAKKAPAKKAPAKKSQATKPKDDHDVVLAVDFPAPPEAPPVDVVGEALAKEAEQERQNGPKGSVLPPVRDKDESAVDPATLKAVRAEAEMMTKASSPRKS